MKLSEVNNIVKIHARVYCKNFLLYYVVEYNNIMRLVIAKYFEKTLKECELEIGDKSNIQRINVEYAEGYAEGYPEGYIVQGLKQEFDGLFNTGVTGAKLALIVARLVSALKLTDNNSEEVKQMFPYGMININYDDLKSWTSTISNYIKAYVDKQDGIKHAFNIARELRNTYIVAIVDRTFGTEPILYVDTTENTGDVQTVEPRYTFNSEDFAELRNKYGLEVKATVDLTEPRNPNTVSRHYKEAIIFTGRKQNIGEIAYIVKSYKLIIKEALGDRAITIKLYIKNGKAVSYSPFKTKIELKNNVIKNVNNMDVVLERHIDIEFTHENKQQLLKLVKTEIDANAGNPLYVGLDEKINELMGNNHQKIRQVSQTKQTEEARKTNILDMFKR